jgi:hypothetical protein
MYSGSSSSFCNVNNNGNANNNNASGGGGVAPDSVSHAKCRAFSPTWPTQKEKASRGTVGRPTANIRLDTSGWTLLAWQAYCVQPVSCPGTLRGIGRNPRGGLSLLPKARMPRKAFLNFILGVYIDE